MAKALAKDPADRYATLRRADRRRAGGARAPDRPAAAAASPPRHARRRRARARRDRRRDRAGIARRRRRRAAGRRSRLGDGLAAIRADGQRIASFTGADTAPSNIAVGEGSVWVLNTRDERVARVDPRTGDVIRSFEPPRAADRHRGRRRGGLDRQRARQRRTHDSVCGSIPPRERSTRTVRLPGGGTRTGDAERGLPADRGRSRGACGRSTPTARSPASIRRAAGASPRSRRRTRRERDRGRRRGRVGSLWTRTRSSRIDPRTNRMRKPIELGSNRLFGHRGRRRGGVGDAPRRAAVARRARAAPDRAHDRRRRRRALRRVRRRRGVGGELERQHRARASTRATNPSTARVPVGAAQALAAGAGSAWVSVAGGSRSGVAAGERLRRVDRRAARRRTC